jgi:hypothetical protein
MEVMQSSIEKVIILVMISLGSSGKRDREVDWWGLRNTVLSVSSKGDACSRKATEYIMVVEWTRIVLQEVHVIPICFE